MSYEYRFVVMDGDSVDYPEMFRRACRNLGLHAIVETYPHIRPTEFSRLKLSDIRRRLARKHPDEVVCFCPGALEHFIDGPDVSFCFSSYRSWHDALRRRVIPHPWSPVRPIGGVDSLRWTGKPSLIISFMGSAYRNSRTAKLVADGPSTLRRWMEVGSLVRSVDRVAWLDEHHIPHRYLPTFIRFEALEAIESAHRRRRFGELEIVDTCGFDGSERQLSTFAEHLERATYVICPRGCENFSFRVFEALRFGRVPVIIDSDMVLPPSIEWEKLALIVRFDRIDEAYDRIVEDHEGRSAEEFSNRQRAAFDVSERLAHDEWLAAEIRIALENLGYLSVNSRCAA